MDTGRPSNKKRAVGKQTETGVGSANFADDFDGAVHSGNWADHFSIICWPITHGILPKDLQKQLACALYESRDRLTGDVLAMPEALGDLIAVRSIGASPRFQHFRARKVARGANCCSAVVPRTIECRRPDIFGNAREDRSRSRQATTVARLVAVRA